MTMLRYQFFVFLLLCSFSFSCKNKTQSETASQYADSIILLQSKMMKQMDTLFQASFFDDFVLGDFYVKAVNKNKECNSKLDKIKYFHDNKELYNASQSFFMTVDHVLKNEAPKLLKLKQKMTIEKSPILQDELDAVLLQSTRKITESQLHFDSVLTVFLGEYGCDVEMDTNAVSHFKKESLKNN